MRYAQLVIGPAGSGKSTYCSSIVEHAALSNRIIQVVNLDPAAEHFSYNPTVDVRDLIHLEDAMEDEDLNFGPNGGLIFCMDGEIVTNEVLPRYLVKNSQWLEEELGDVDDDYILFDCPGQIELYTHMNTMKNIVEILQKINFRVCAVFLIDAQFMVDGAKFISGTMAALSVMVNLELPHVNVLSKMDQLGKVRRSTLDSFLDPDSHELIGSVEKSSQWSQRYLKLTSAIANLIEDYSLVRFHPLNIRNEDSLTGLLLTIDNIIQFGEDADVKTHDFEYPDGDDE